jgi:hypothetical protein
MLRDATSWLPRMVDARQPTVSGCSCLTPDRFEFDGARLTTHVDATNGPNILNVPQVRDIRLEGDKMILGPPGAAWAS